MSFPIFRHEKPWDEDREARRRAAARHDEDMPERTSIWKRELSFGRRKSPSVEPEAAAPAVLAVETEEKKPSIWKRELSLGRKKAPSVEPADLDPEAADEVLFVEEPVGWPISEAAPVDEAQAEDVAPEASSWQSYLSGLNEQSPEEPEPVDEAPVDDVQAEAFSWQSLYVRPEQLEVVDDSSDERKPSFWKRELSFGRKKAVAPEEVEVESMEVEADEAEPVAVEPVAVEPVAVEPEPAAWPTPIYEDVEAPEPVSWQPPLSPEVPSDVVELEASEPAPAPVEEPKKSIFRRELSFGRARRSEDWELDTEEDAAAEAALVPAAPVADDMLDAEDEPARVGRRERRRAAKAERREQKEQERQATRERKEGDPMDEDERSVEQPKAPTAKRSRTVPGGKNVKKLVGLKIGASQIAAAYIANNGSPHVIRVARMPLERGVVVAGEIRDPDALATALRDFFKENKLPRKGVRLGIGSNRVGVRVLDVAGIEDQSLLGNAVRFRAQELLPIPLSEAVLDYRVLRDREEEDGTVTHEVLVAFAYRELVDRCLQVCRAAGLKLEGIDLEGFALLRALVDPQEATDRLGGAAVVTVALGHDRSIMSVSDGAVCEFTRVIDWGGASFDTAVARVLALTPSQAEPIKRQLALDGSLESPASLSAEQVSRVTAAMQQEVHAFAREFVSSLQFYQAQPRSLDIGEIVLTGGTADMPGLADQLRELIGVSVRVGDPLSRVELGKDVDASDASGSLALAIGLGIED